MPHFTVYDSTGTILRSGWVAGDESAAQAQCAPGENALVGVAGRYDCDRVHLPADGSTPSIVAIEVAAPSLADQQTAALAQLAERRWQIETGGITVAGRAIRTDRESQALINGALTYFTLNPGASLSWKTADGTFANVDEPTLRAIATAVAGHVQACFAREAALAPQIAAATDESQLAPILASLPAFWS